jgi:hypothetical protein
MSTTMTERDYACGVPSGTAAAGRQGGNNRVFLEALRHYEE